MLFECEFRLFTIRAMIPVDRDFVVFTVVDEQFTLQACVLDLRLDFSERFHVESPE